MGTFKKVANRVDIGSVTGGPRPALQFKEWFVVNEGLWSAAVAGIQAFRGEISRPKSLAFEAQIGSIASATDVLFAVDKFYKVVQPSVDPTTAKKLETKLESAVRKVGFNLHPKDIISMGRTVTKASPSL